MSWMLWMLVLLFIIVAAEAFWRWAEKRIPTNENHRYDDRE